MGSPLDQICMYKILELIAAPLFYLPYSGTTTRRFVGHTKDVLSVAFSADNRQIVSAARDHTIKLWNTLGVCKYTIQVHCTNLPAKNCDHL